MPFQCFPMVSMEPKSVCQRSEHFRNIFISFSYNLFFVMHFWKLCSKLFNACSMRFHVCPKLVHVCSFLFKAFLRFFNAFQCLSMLFNHFFTTCSILVCAFQRSSILSNFVSVFVGFSTCSMVLTAFQCFFNTCSMLFNAFQSFV